MIYAEGVYEGSLLARPVKGCAVLVLKTGYVRETNNRYYVTSRLDCFLSIEPAGAELLTKTVSPLLGQTADSNFLLTGFVVSISRTTELNSRSSGPGRQARPRAAGGPRGVSGLAGNSGKRPPWPPRPRSSENADAAAGRTSFPTPSEAPLDRQTGRR